MKYDTIKTTLTIETHLFMKHTYFEMKALLFKQLFQRVIDFRNANLTNRSLFRTDTSLKKTPLSE